MSGQPTFQVASAQVKRLNHGSPPTGSILAPLRCFRRSCSHQLATIFFLQRGQYGETARIILVATTLGSSLSGHTPHNYLPNFQLDHPSPPLLLSLIPLPPTLQPFSFFFFLVMPGDILSKRKIAVLGSRSVGKSSLVIQFIENHFVESYYPTIESTFTKSINYKGVEYDCDIIDTAGQDEYTLLNAKHAIGTHGFVLVYSVASRKSFDMVRVIYDKIAEFSGINQIPCVIVGAKSDLQQSISRQVAQNEGQDLANRHHAAWIESSAKANVNVGEFHSENCPKSPDEVIAHEWNMPHSASL
ncbi:hypothetical protein AcV5_000806 [Taiwanofungus camphoratus]|nr:hypothetical protein AcW2_006563 [Antrodia cinnamomea]KAI0939364.1 hypothetical protein AcV5_000806 [Antrodia cinnamomea]KAI0952284.1 hypothetical protein AcV7_008146 [Antrodia cinnamomea]